VSGGVAVDAGLQCKAVVNALLDDSEANTEREAFYWHSVDLMVVVDASLTVMRVNPAFERVMGADWAGRSALEISTVHDRPKVEGALTGCLAGGARSFDAQLAPAGRALRAAEWSAFSEPASERVFVVIRDVTSRRRLEGELAQARKLEAIGRLASGIAHEINSPIQFVGDNLAFIGESLREVFVLLHALEREPALASVLAANPNLDLAFLTAELPNAVEQACEGVQRVGELVRGMKEFAHQDHGEVTATDLNRALERTIAVARNEWKYVAEVVTDFGELPKVPCQASAMRQVFLNLICNAAHATGEQNTLSGRARGQITVTTRCDAKFVTISVTDSGTGIPVEVRPHLFEPFFTTKPVGQGTGQGLAISRSIICEKHGGRLEFETEVGRGTTFIVTLPLRGALPEFEA
jgi:PAS domain S-box-containing protein